MAHNPRSSRDWNDLRYFLAVAREGSTLAAERALKVDQSTVQRRLLELERQLGQALVRRHPRGYRLTEFGQEMLPHAERVEQAVLGDAEEDLVRVLGPIDDLTRIWRLLTSPALRRTPRVAAFFDFVVAANALTHSCRYRFRESDTYRCVGEGTAPRR